VCDFSGYDEKDGLSDDKLRLQIADQKEQIAKLRDFNSKLQAEIKQLRTNIDQLTLQLSVVQQTDTKPRVRSAFPTCI